MNSSQTRAKVCHIMHDGSGQGGGATFALACFPAYNTRFDTFAVVGNDGNLADRLRARGVRTLTLAMSRPLRCLLSWPSLWHILRRERPDAVIVHGQWAGFFGSIAARLAGIKTVIYYTHFPSFYSDWDLFRVVRNRVAESVTCRNSSVIVCLSAAGRYQYLLRRFAPEEKFIHLYNGLDPAALTEIVTRESLLRDLNPAASSDDQVVVSVGRLSDQKRIDWLLRAWALVEPAAPRARLAIIGSGPDEPALQRLAGELNLQRCRFLGPRSHGYAYFRAADCGVICSMYEGHPLALIEAMLVSCPMVGTSVDGIGETILDGVTGFLVPPADPARLAQAILALLSDPVRAREMGEAGRRRAEELYHAEAILQRQLRLVEEQLRRA
jgi:glycosyltransferase involved in cell wall biosynthesis